MEPPTARPPRASDAPAADQSRIKHFRQSLGLGPSAGVVATLIMTAFRLPVVRSLPPTANVWARYVGDGEPEDYPTIGLSLHLLYGAAGGVGFGVLYGLLGSKGAGEPEERGLVLGTIYGLVLSAFGARVVLPTFADAHLEDDELALFHAAHLIYGASLGAWIGSRTAGTDDPEQDYDYEPDDAGLRDSARELLPSTW